MYRKTIAVLMASIDREYQSDFVRGVLASAAERDMDVCIFNCQGYMNEDVAIGDAGESSVFDLCRIRRFDGFISLRATLADEASIRKVNEILREFAGVPHISVDVPAENGVSFMFDDAVSVRKLTEHVITAHGARDIVYLSGPLRKLVARVRLEACREAMKAHGLTLAEENVFEGEWIHSSGRECAERLLKREQGLPDAILCGNDDMAFGVIDYLQDHEIAVPDDVIVTGFDALREATSRGITTIRRPIDRLAREAVGMLDAWIDGKLPETREVRLPTIPVYGESCGCKRDHGTPGEESHLVRRARRQVEKTLLQIAMFNCSLASVADEADAYEKIDQFASALGIREMYICVDPSLTREITQNRQGYAYPEKMLMLYGRREQQAFPIQLMDIRELVPVLDRDRERALGLVFCPLYYRERSFGYLAIEVGAAAGVALYSVLMLLNGALTSLYLQTSLRRYAHKVEEMSVRDIMTGLLNRRGFMERAEEKLEQAREEKRCFVLLSADMDDMKKINDRYGHLIGDQAIIRMGSAMKALAREELVPVHISGDEFLVYGIAESPEEAAKLPAAAREAVDRMNREDPWIVGIGASFGLYAAVPGEEEDLDLFITRADRAMYQEKNRKKNAGA